MIVGWIAGKRRYDVFAQHMKMLASQQNCIRSILQWEACTMMWTFWKIERYCAVFRVPRRVGSLCLIQRLMVLSLRLPELRLDVPDHL